MISSEFRMENFYKNGSLEGLQFFYAVPNLDWKSKSELSSAITKLNGVSHNLLKINSK